jgi:hypothetical protein
MLATSDTINRLLARFKIRTINISTKKNGYLYCNSEEHAGERNHVT